MNWLRHAYRSRRPYYRLTYAPEESTLIDIDDPNATLQVYPTEPRVLPVSYKSSDLTIPIVPKNIPDCDVDHLKSIGFDIDIPQHILGSGASAAVFSGIGNHRAKRYYILDTTAVDLNYLVDSKYSVYGRGDIKYLVDSYTDRPVAVKFIHMRFVGVDREEAEKMANLEHPNIVELYDVMTVGKRLYIIMEYCSGGTIGAYLEKCAKTSRQLRKYRQKYPETLTQPMCESFIFQLFVGLLYIHEQQLLHTDIHRNNVLLVRSETDSDNITLKYVDFGVAVVIGSTADYSIQTDLEALGKLMRLIVAAVFEGGDQGANERLNRLASDLIGQRYATVSEAGVELNSIIGM